MWPNPMITVQGISGKWQCLDMVPTPWSNEYQLLKDAVQADSGFIKMPSMFTWFG